MPFWAQALALCALFAIAGVAVVDDYGVGWDEFDQRQTARANVDYALGGSLDTPNRHDRYYGVAIELPLLLAERALRLQDIRHIYLTRHLLTHLFFIAGGFACGMLAYRTLGSRWIALFAMLMFLLHPRLYAHSFFNSKDVPFAALLLIALYLAHRAFRKDTGGAFMLCGIVAGLAINLRPFALMLLPMILALRALDLRHAGKAERKHILATAGIFAAAALATAYITHPYYWESPLRFVEGLRVLSQHPTLVENLFMGEIYSSDAVPWNFIPVWFAITAPPAALTLGAIGCAVVCWQATARPLAALRDRETRFRVMLLGCVALPVAVVIALQANIYTGWRQMYFLWAPFCLLAAVGLHIIANIRMGGGIWKVGDLLPEWARGGYRLHMARRALAYGVAGAGLLTTLTAMAALHPYEYVYFNALTDTKTPGALAKRYDMDYWWMSQRQSLEHLLARYPDDALRVWMRNINRQSLPQNDRERIPVLDNLYAADFYLWPARGFHLPFANPQESGIYRLLHPAIDPRNIPDQPPIYSVKAYGSAIALIYGKDAHAYRAAYEDVAANGEPLARLDFDIYAYDGALYYLSADCPPPAPNQAALRIFLHITPANPDYLPAASREHGFENRDFRLDNRAAFFDGKCIHRQLLPNYPIERIATGQKTTSGVAEWRADIDLAARAAAQAAYYSIAVGDYGKLVAQSDYDVYLRGNSEQPVGDYARLVAQSDFDVYLRGNALTYLKEPCAPGDTDAWFFLHIFPADPADLSADRREFGFANMDFHFADHGAYTDDKCVVERELPGYAIEYIRTGQFVRGEGPLWSAGFSTVQPDFDVYLHGNSLAYLKAPCSPSDAQARFFLHIIPAAVADLPAAARERGFENLDFRFTDHGARIDDRCVATLKLPAYPVERIRTGQFISGEGSLWRVEFPIAR